MKKAIIFVLLLGSTLYSFSQEKFHDTKKYPFQVLFVEDAVSKKGTITQFDFLAKNEMISCTKELIIIHHTGEIITLEDTIIDLKEISKSLKEKTQHRPFINPENKHLALQYSSSSVCLTQSIRILHPAETVIEHSHTLPFFASWELYNQESDIKDYLILIQSIYDDPIDTLRTSANYINIDLSKYEVKDNLLVYSVISAQNPDVRSLSIGIKLVNQSSEKDQYRLILAALENDMFSQEEIANHFYLSSIEKSNQDPRFIKLYEDFLARNPKFEN